MISKLTSAQRNAFDQMSRSFASAYTGGLSQFMNDLLAEVSGGSVGIQSDAADLDSLALGGGAFTYDSDSSSGLTFAFKAGRFHNGLAEVAVAAGTVALTASVTNYIEVDRSGTVTANTTAFTSGKLPLYQVVAGASSFVDGNVTSKKPLLSLIGTAGVNGTMLSTPAATKSVQQQLGAIAATTSFLVVAPCTGAISLADLINTAAIATSDTDYWTAAIVNKGAANSGTQQLLDTGAGNTTKLTGGAGLSANIRRSLVLTTLSIGTELNVTKGDALLVTLTKTGAPTALANAALKLDFTFTN